MKILHIDFETRSEVDLIKHGAYLYATHPSTQVICMGWAFDDEEPELWTEGQEVPDRVKKHLADGLDGSIHAHNAAFERLIFWYVMCPDYDLPEPPLESFYCTAALCRSRGLPGKLDHAAQAMGAPLRKDPRGAALIQMCCVPPFNMEPDVLAELGVYCLQDVRVERVIDDALPPLDELEQEEYWANEIINDRGLLIDREACQLASHRAAEEKAELNSKLNAFTDGDVQTARQFQRINAWLKPRLPDWAVDACTVYKKDEKKFSFASDIRADLLKRADELEPEVLEFIEMIEAGSNSAVAKFNRMLDRMDPEDDRLRGAYVFAGGAGTGRFSSTGAQMHNLKRQCVTDIEQAKATLRKNVPFEKEPIMVGKPGKSKPAQGLGDALGSMLRPVIHAEPGSVLNYADWSSIEARCLPWLAGHYASAQILLDVFRNDEDVYIYDAQGIYHKDDIDEDERQVGKVARLSLGFGGADGALLAMARGYGVSIDNPSGVVAGWRKTNPWAQPFWKELSKAAMRAMRRPGRWFDVNLVAYRSERIAGTTWLLCKLPSGRNLYYADARIVEGRYGKTISAVKAALRPKANATEWTRHDLWYGILAENITQAACADILRDKLVTCVDEGLVVAGHTHDEIICEDADIKLLEEIMLEGLHWTTGLPMGCTIDTAVVYGK